jgi:hypothetical protein
LLVISDSPMATVTGRPHGAAHRRGPAPQAMNLQPTD